MAIEFITGIPTNRITTDFSLSVALRDVLLTTGVTPQTTLAQPVHAGDTSVTVADPSVFSPSQLFSFYDGTDFDGEDGEEELPIRSDWDGLNPIPINWDTMDYPGYKLPHAKDVAVGTNLFYDAPDNIDVMLQGPDPLIYFVILDERAVLRSGHQYAPVFAVHIDYRRALVQPKGSGADWRAMDANVWSKRQQRRSRRDLLRIELTVNNNETLMTTRENCVSLGDPSAPQKDRFQITWTKVLIDQETQHFVAQSDFTVEGFWRVFGRDIP